MDSALLLKIKYDRKEINDLKSTKKLLDESLILKKLLSDFQPDVLNLHWRLNQLSEIPFTGKIEKVQKWLDKLIDLTYTKDGFSLTGKSDYILSCYNAMITTLLIKLDSPETVKIMTGIDWILKYQNFERDLECKWEGTGIKKYGGCMKATPCYIGLVKSLITLSELKKRPDYKKNTILETKFKKGLEYILEHEVYKRKSDNKPITNYIDKISYPFYWKTNIIEILRLLKENDKINDPRCQSAKDLLLKKRKKDGYWHNSPIHTSHSWILLDKKKEPALWVSYVIDSILSSTGIK